MAEPGERDGASGSAVTPSLPPQGGTNSIAFVRSVETELRALCGDLKKKHANVKATAEQAIARLKELVDENRCDNAALRDAPGIVETFCLACEITPGTAKMSMRVVSALNMLLSRSAVRDDQLDRVVSACAKQIKINESGAADDALTIKILQALLSLLSSPSYRTALGLQGLSRALCLLLSMQSKSASSSSFQQQQQQQQSMLYSGSSSTVLGVSASAGMEMQGVVEQTVEAAFRQIVSDMLACAKESFAKNAQSPSAGEEGREVLASLAEIPAVSALRLDVPASFSQTQAFAYLTVVDVCMLLTSSSQLCLLNQLARPLRFGLAVDVILDALNTGIFEASDAFQALLSERLCPQIHSVLRSAPATNSLYVLYRILELVVVLIRDHFDGVMITDAEIFLTHLCRMVISPGSQQMQGKPASGNAGLEGAFLASEVTHWFVMEALRALVCKPHFVRRMASVYDFVKLYPDPEREDGSTKVVSRTSSLGSHSGPGPGVAAGPKQNAIVWLILRSAFSCLERTKYALDQLPWNACTNQLVPFGALRNAVPLPDALAATCLGCVFAIAHAASLAGVASEPETDVGQKQWCVLYDGANGDSIMRLVPHLIQHVPLDMSFVTKESQEQQQQQQQQVAGKAVSMATARGNTSTNPHDVLKDFLRDVMVCLNSGEFGTVYHSLRSVLFSEIVRSCLRGLTAKKDTKTASSGSLVENALKSEMRTVRLSQFVLELALQVLPSSLHDDEWIELVRLVEAIENRADGGSAFGNAVARFFERAQALTDLLSRARFVRALMAYTVAQSIHDAGAATSDGSAASASSVSVATRSFAFGLSRLEHALEAWLSNAGDDASISEESVALELPHELFMSVLESLVRMGSSCKLAAWRELSVSCLGRLIGCGLAATSKFLPDALPQGRMISPLNELLYSPFPDTQAMVLRSVHYLLDACGEILQDDRAWSRLLFVLQRASGIEEDAFDEPDEALASIGGGSNNTNVSVVLNASAATPTGAAATSGESSGSSDSVLQLGFKSVQLIGGDFLPYLSPIAMTIWIRILGLYAAQRLDVNISLTSVGLMWRTADHLAKTRSDGSLWVCLFEEMRKLDADMRPEVRHGSIRTLTGACAAHGAVLDAETWRDCFRKSFIPLMDDISLKSRIMQEQTQQQESSNELDKVVGSASSSSSSAAAPRLLVHHSRDTPIKQWYETRQLALSGISRVVRLYVAQIGALDDFLDSIWMPILHFAQASACMQIKDVATAGVAALLELLYASASVQSSSSPPPETDATLPSSFSSIKRSTGLTMWSSLWVGLEAIVSGEPCSEEDKDEMIILEAAALVALHDGFGSAKSQVLEVCDATDFERLMGMLLRSVKRARLPGWRDTWTWPGVSEVAASALVALEKIDYGRHHEETWTTLMRALLDLLDQGLGRARIADASDGVDDDSSKNVTINEALTRRVIHSVRILFDESSHMPQNVKAHMLENTLMLLSAFMAGPNASRARASHEDPHISAITGHLKGGSSSSKGTSVAKISSIAASTSLSALPLWCIATQAFTVAVQNGKSSSLKFAPQFFNVYPGIIDRFLFPAGGKGSGLSTSHLQQRLRDSFDVLMTDSVVDIVEQTHALAPSKFVESLMDTLASASLLGTQRSQLARAAQRGLFRLARCMSTGLPDQCILRISKHVLTRYLADSRRAGQCPLPHVRRAESIFLLQCLATRFCATDLTANQSAASGTGGTNAPNLGELYECLCECIMCRDDVIQHFANALMLRIGASVHLIRP
ncbi:Protein MON2-like [Porphyridium purpureum]|uniref:Protein MON2-like n=1 Tax=Porphyridium purpureum TaxID=35688 RepID=A0A5J4YPC1_PORPP|nr:Protein MON2-like [Porphyridium purpureum]|eukprot:POR8781..scf295_9